MSVYWIKTWMLFNDTERDSVPAISEIQEKYDDLLSDGPVDDVIKVEVLEISSVTPPKE